MIKWCEWWNSKKSKYCIFLHNYLRISKKSCTFATESRPKKCVKVDKSGLEKCKEQRESRLKKC